MEREDFLQKTYAARSDAFAKLGTVDGDVIAPIINPGFMGGPVWPDFRQAWRRITTPSTTIYISDGLSDPFDDIDFDEANEILKTGYGLECLLETPDALDSLFDNWAFKLTRHISNEAASSGQFRYMIPEYQFLTIAVPGITLPAPYYCEEFEGSVVMFGIPPKSGTPKVALPGGSIFFMTVKLLTEAEQAVAVDKEGRADLAKRFEQQDSFHLSSLQRPSVV